MNHLDPESVSKTMSRIRGKDTGIEKKLRKALHELGIPYRLNSKYVFGHPDVSSKKYKVAVFCDSEFWHGYEFEENKKKLKWNRDYWIKKIERNMERDLEVNETLKKQGYKVLRFWGKRIEKDVEGCAQEVLQAYIEGGYKEKRTGAVLDSSVD